MRGFRRMVGFTLIELLVVVAIIALLIAILIPALGRAKGLAAQSTCGANLAGLGKSILIYAGDNNDNIPVRVNPTSGPNVFDAFDASRQLLRFDQRNLKIFACPADTDASRLYPMGSAANGTGYVGDPLGLPGVMASAGGATAIAISPAANSPDVPVAAQAQNGSVIDATGLGAGDNILGIAWQYSPGNPGATARISYGLNGNMTVTTQQDSASSSKLLSYQAPAQTFLYGDCTWVNDRGLAADSVPGNGTAFGTSGKNAAMKNHYGRDLRWRVIMANYPDRLLWKGQAWSAKAVGTDVNTGCYYDAGGTLQNTGYSTDADMAPLIATGGAASTDPYLQASGAMYDGLLTKYYRHPGGANIGFLDGHVEAVKGPTIFSYDISQVTATPPAEGAAIVWSWLETAR